jgi:hypothetical protein
MVGVSSWLVGAFAVAVVVILATIWWSARGD